jgi:hypothetical protein
MWSLSYRLFIPYVLHIPPVLFSFPIILSKFESLKMTLTSAIQVFQIPEYYSYSFSADKNLSCPEKISAPVNKYTGPGTASCTILTCWKYSDRSYQRLKNSHFDQERFLHDANPRAPKYSPKLGPPRRLVRGALGVQDLQKVALRASRSCPSAWGSSSRLQVAAERNLLFSVCDLCHNDDFIYFLQRSKDISLFITLLNGPLTQTIFKSPALFENAKCQTNWWKRQN